ncbi:MAG: hypothetical protein P9L99_09420 [Candidatus Lernaella stagnicola]|nr:hypothetical protein [Candidatus Lernaella stagnicola]
MTTRGKRFLAVGIIAAGLLVLGVPFFVFVWPYIQPAPVPRAELEKTVAEWKVFADAVRSHPQADRQAFDEFCRKHKEFLEKGKAASGSGGEESLFFSEESVAEVAANRETLQQLIVEFDAFAADGLVLYQDYALDAETMDFLPIWGLAYWWGTMAAQGEEFMPPYRRASQLIASLMENDILFSLMIGITIEAIVDPALIQRLPQLSPEDLAQAAEIIKQRPDLFEQLLRSTKIYAYAGFSSLTTEAEGGESIFIDEESKRFLWPLHVPGLLERERWWYVYAMDEMTKRLRVWYDNGATGEPVGDLMAQILDHSILSAIMAPDMARFVRSAVLKCVARRKALLAAIEAEPQRRATGGTTRLPYFDDVELVITDKHGDFKNTPKTTETP